MKNETQSFARQFFRHPFAVIGISFLLVEILVLLFAPVIFELDPYEITKGGFNVAPTGEHLLGTDDLGRDVLARLLYGGRISLFVGFVSTLISAAIGVPLGLIAGYYKGVWEQVILRLADTFMSVPSMILIITVVAAIGPSLRTIIICIGVTGWTSVAKLIYGNVLSVCKKDYVEAAKAIGMKNRTILIRYILPNAITPLWMSLAFHVSSAIITESGLSFLGAGIQAPEASWGNILYSAQNLVVLTQRWWLWIPAGVLLFLTVVCINLIGETIRDILDPR